ncbi:uncharacterized protein PV09_06719, partial [Verruconis gallopava]
MFHSFRPSRCALPFRRSSVVQGTPKHCWTRAYSSTAPMASWSRVPKYRAPPPPLYLTSPDVKYCRTCGRVVSERRSHKRQATEAKYCSATCRSQRPGARDRRAEAAFAALLNGERRFDGEAVPQYMLELCASVGSRNESGLVVPCSAVECLMFGARRESVRERGHRVGRDGAAEDANDESKGSAQDEEGERRRREGQRVADERELVKRAARRACVFGLKGTDGEQEATRMCEAIMNGSVVEPSFAKGDWGIRWRT